MPPTVHVTLRAATEALGEAGVDNPVLDARLLFQAASGMTHADILSRPDEEVGLRVEMAFDAMLERRLFREPVSKILRQKSFWDMDLLVTADVLDPRPDTETLVEAVLEARPDRGADHTIVDLGTGSGCIILALLREYPNARGIAVDKSPVALAVARYNAEQLGLSDRVSFVCGDWASAVADGLADIVVSNPPYIRQGDMAGLMPEVRDYDPALALEGGADGLDAYRAIIADLQRLTGGEGLVMFELGEGQADDVATMLQQEIGANILRRNDLSGIARCVGGTWRNSAKK